MADRVGKGGIGAGVMVALGVAVTVVVVVGAVLLVSTPEPEEHETIDGLPVHTVAEALAARDAGTLDGRAVAIRGYYSTTPGHSCPAALDRPAPLELYCREGDWALAQLDEAVAEITRTVTDTSVELSVRGRPMRGPWLQLAWLGPATGDRLSRHFPRVTDMNRAVPVVLIGHFGDPRASLCSAEKLRACAERFVIDRVARAAGESFGPEIWPAVPVNGVATASSLEEVEGFVQRELGDDRLVLSMAALRGSDLLMYDTTTPVDPADPRLLWYVWAVDGVGADDPAVADRIGRLIFADASGELLWSGF